MLVLTILRLPPGLQSVGSERGDDVLDAMALGLLRQLIVRLRGVAHEALLLLLDVERWGGGERGVNAEGNSKHSSLFTDTGGYFLTTGLQDTKIDMLCPGEGSF